jgi:hypothetical protein
MLELVFSNAVTQNSISSPVYTDALRLSEKAAEIRSEIKLSPDYGGDYIAPPKPRPPSPIEEDIEKLITELPYPPVSPSTFMHNALPLILSRFQETQISRR